MRINLVLIGALLLVGCSTMDVRGTSAADARLKRDTYRLLSLKATADLQCRSIDHVEVSDSAVSGATATENWTAFGCGRSKMYKVEYTPAPSGGYFFSVTDAGR